MSHPSERENGQLCQLLEPKYRALGASPPVVPKWTDRRGFGATAAAAAAARSLPTGDATGASPGGVDGSARVTDLLQFSDLFVVEGGWVKARVVPSGIEDGDVIASPVSGAASVSADGETITAEVTDNSSKAVAAAAAAAQCVATRAAVKTLAGVVGSVCEARQEALLKECMPGAQKYVAELEAYRSAIVGGSALRAAAGAGIGKAGGARGARGAPINGSDRSSAEIDDDLWRLFGAMETRLYSSPAALGKKPGRIYLTYNTLWFYSKVRWILYMWLRIQQSFFHDCFENSWLNSSVYHGLNPFFVCLCSRVLCDFASLSGKYNPLVHKDIHPKQCFRENESLGND